MPQFVDVYKIKDQNISVVSTFFVQQTVLYIKNLAKKQRKTNSLHNASKVVICWQVLSEERVTGTVTTELPQPESQGRISYENRGECFFLPYCKEDVEGNVTLRAGDKVSFQIATNQR